MSSSEGQTELGVQLAEELDASIGDLTRLSAGASRETWSFDADGSPLILQRARPGATAVATQFDEGALLRHAHLGGVSVPEVVASSFNEQHPIGSQFVICRRLDGESIARKILRDDRFEVARRGFVADCARELARIHSLDPTPMRDQLAIVGDPVETERAAYEAFDDPHPVFDLAFRWLEDNRPTARTPVVVHGDFRLGNLLIGDEGIAAVLDWELSQLGDPVLDLGWLVARAWRFGGSGEVGGLGSRAELLELYEASGGARIEMDELRWWEVLASLRWGVITMLMAEDGRRGGTASLEQAAIGRRVVETEYDVLLLLREELA